jgi:hypothetical protein
MEAHDRKRMDPWGISCGSRELERPPLVGRRVKEYPDDSVSINLSSEDNDTKWFRAQTHGFQ